MQKELLDLGPDYYTHEEYQDCLKKLHRVGQLLGGDRASWKTLKNENPKSLLEVGCGGGFFTRSLAEHFPNARVTGVDISSDAIAIARELHQNELPNLQYQHQKSPDLSSEFGNFDIVTATLVCHHMREDEIINFLNEATKTANQCVILNDLHRHWVAYGFYALLAPILFRNRLITHDGLLSIKRSFVHKDWVQYLKAAGIPKERYEIQWRFPFRWIVRIRCGE